MRHGRLRQAERDGSLAALLLKGAVAGAVAVWAMDRLDWFAYRQEAPKARAQTRRVRPGGMDPAHVAVSRAAGMAGTGIPSQPNAAGIGLHYGIGIVPGALYAAMRDRVDGLGFARGPLYGLGLFLFQDEAFNAASGLSAQPARYPWQAHARGLVAHLVYGLATELALDAMDAVSRAGSSTRRRIPFPNRTGQRTYSTRTNENVPLWRDPKEARAFARAKELASATEVR